MSLVDGVVHRLTCTKNRSCHPGMVDKPLCSIRQVTVPNYKTAKFSYTSTSESATSKRNCQIICLAPDMGVCTNRRFVLTKIIISII